MGAKTPPSIKKEVIKHWFKGRSRDQIAREIDIGAGTVSSIIKECKQNDPDFDLLREVAFIIKNDSLDLNFLASSIRLRKVLEENGLNEEQIESFIEKKLVVTERELEKITRERDTLEMETSTNGWKIHKLEQEMVNPTDQLAIVNKKLDIPTDPKELDDLMKDFREHLGKYPDIINLMRKHLSHSFLDLKKHLII